MSSKGSGWRNESRRHSMARKGIKTADLPYSRVRVDKTSGIWFESNGMLSEMVTLVQLFGFDDLLANNKAKGLPKEQYDMDASKIIVFPSDKSKDTINWLISEYAHGDRVRKKQVKRLLDVAVKEIDRELGAQENIDIRIDLHQSRKMFRELQKGLNT